MINLLNLALPIIRQLVDFQTFEYRTYVGQTVNEAGISVPKYSAWKTCDGSVQPMDATNGEMFGLDSARDSILVWGSIDFNTLDLYDHCDQVRYDGRIYNCYRVTKWHKANGWNAFACTEDKRERADKPKAEQKPIKVDPEPEIKW